MRAEIVMIGTELLLGQIADTNATHIARMLAEHAINLYYKTTVGDNELRIFQALDSALNRADVVITSGGLGPTEDDVTRECIASLLSRPLEFRQDLYDTLTERFRRLRRPITANNRKQAFAPQGARPIPNPHGTAPGLIVEDARGVIIAMPGVPAELHPMLEEQVIPYLRERFGLQGVLHSRVLKVCGVGESRIDAAIGDLIRNQRNPTVGVLASPDVVRIRITARAGSTGEANRLIEPVDAEVRNRLPGLVMGVDGATLEGAVGALLAQRNWRMAVAEFHTGGMLAQRMVAAEVQAFAGAVVRPFAPDWKPSPDAAQQHAEEVRDMFAAECGLAIVPDAAERRTRAVWAAPDGVRHWQFGFGGVASIQQVRAATTALELVRRALAGVDAEGW